MYICINHLVYICDFTNNELGFVKQKTERHKSRTGSTCTCTCTLYNTNINNAYFFLF